MAHGIDTKECSISEKLSEARRRRQGLDHDKNLHSSSSSAMSANDRPPTLEDTSGALDLSKTPPVEPAKLLNPLALPNRAAPTRSSGSQDLDSERSEHLAEATLTTSISQGDEHGEMARGSDESDENDTARSTASPHHTKSLDSEGKSLRDKNTADKQCDKYSNPADSEEDEPAGGGRRLTRNQARLASLRRREHEKESTSAGGPPSKIPKVELPSSEDSPNVNIKNETELRSQRNPDEPSEKRKDDVANNNSVDGVVDRACPYCGHNCSNPSDMKRHLLVHMETKPFVCKVGCVSLDGGGSFVVTNIPCA